MATLPADPIDREALRRGWTQTDEDRRDFCPHHAPQANPLEPELLGLADRPADGEPPHDQVELAALCRQGQQWCIACADFTCCDNTNPARPAKETP